jgi:predicted metalloprotease
MRLPSSSGPSAPIVPRSVAVRTAFVVAVLLGVSACAGGVSGTPAVGTGIVSNSSSVPTTDDSVVASTVDSSTLASGVTIDELVDDIASAEQVVDGYWATHWGDFFTGTYQPPTVKGLYDGTDPATIPTCDGEPLEAYNALYCVSEDYVAWDSGLLLDGADQIGDTWVYLVIAHEWGHAIQARLDTGLVAVADELQADCLGAAALFGAVADGTLELEEGDEREMISSLNVLADDMAWTMTSDHGDSFQRVEWFTIGRNGGVQACFDAAGIQQSGAPESGSAPPTS